MTAVGPDTRDAVARLRSALSSPAMPPREAQSCERLVEKLSRPVRVGVFGLNSGGDDWLLGEILGSGILPQGPDWPTLEVIYGPEMRTEATLEDGMTLTESGPASPALLAERPVFLRIEAPHPALRRIAFLYLATGDTAAEQLSALDWAEPRTDIAIWTTEYFSDAEARIWAAAPDRLKNHAILVATGPNEDEAELSARAGFEFDGVYAVPRTRGARSAVDRLMQRLDADIDDARAADIDAAQLFLHRLGHLAGPMSHKPAKDSPAAARRPRTELQLVSTESAAEPLPEPLPEPAAERAALPEKTVVAPEVLARISEPFLYLKRRARALWEMLEWQTADEEAEAEGAWAGDVLEHCVETTEGLRSRAAAWPEDDPRALTLRRTLEEACDVAILLQVEGGRDQAQDAAAMLLQLRGEFERELAA
ncbi:MAG: hypothetical protein AAF914_10170 [Pseudomonadota bacterium]